MFLYSFVKEKEEITGIHNFVKRDAYLAEKYRIVKDKLDTSMESGYSSLMESGYSSHRESKSSSTSLATIILF